MQTNPFRNLYSQDRFGLNLGILLGISIYRLQQRYIRKFLVVVAQIEHKVLDVFKYI